MCGLYGVMGPGIQKKDLQVLQDLGLISQLRGLEGSGMWQMRSNGSRKQTELWYKTSSSFQEMLDEISYDKELKNLMNDIHANVFMGHVRWPTRGSRTSNNAHPFVFDSIVGAHNGTLHDVKYQHATKTDSEMMFTDMTSRGIVPVLRDLNENSAYAISLFDINQQAMYFARNDKRTLYFAALEERNVIYWASEAGFLQLVLNREGMAHKIIPLPPHKVYKIYPHRMTQDKTPWLLHHDFKAEKEAEAQKRELDLEKRIADSVEKQINEKKVQQEQKKTTNVVPFAGGRRVVAVPQIAPSQQKPVVPQQVVVKSLHRKCNCGKKTLNLFEIYESKRGTEGHLAYDHINDRFFCGDCLENTSKDEVKNA